MSHLAKEQTEMPLHEARQGNQASIRVINSTKHLLSDPLYRHNPKNHTNEVSWSNFPPNKPSSTIYDNPNNFGIIGRTLQSEDVYILSMLRLLREARKAQLNNKNLFTKDPLIKNIDQITRYLPKTKMMYGPDIGATSRYTTHQKEEKLYPHVSTPISPIKFMDYINNSLNPSATKAKYEPQYEAYNKQLQLTEDIAKLDTHELFMYSLNGATEVAKAAYSLGRPVYFIDTDKDHVLKEHCIVDEKFLSKKPLTQKEVEKKIIKEILKFRIKLTKTDEIYNLNLQLDYIDKPQEIANQLKEKGITFRFDTKNDYNIIISLTSQNIKNIHEIVSPLNQEQKRSIDLMESRISELHKEFSNAGLPNEFFSQRQQEILEELDQLNRSSNDIKSKKNISSNLARYLNIDGIGEFIESKKTSLLYQNFIEQQHDFRQLKLTNFSLNL